jgi:hypothetical protein
LHLIQEDRAAFCKRGRFYRRGRRAGSHFILGPTDGVGGLVAPCVISITNRIDAACYQRVKRQARQGAGRSEIAGELEMKASLWWIRVGTVAVMLLSLGNLYNSLYVKSRHVSRCGAHLAQLQLLEGQIDTTEAKLKAAESRFDRVKR